MRVDIRHDMNKLSLQLKLYPREQLAAAVRALNKTLTTVRAEAARAMRSRYQGIKIAKLKKQMRFKRATRQVPIAVLVFSNRRFQLFGNFGMRRKGAFGVAFSKLPWRIETGDGRQIAPDVLRRAFLNRSKAHGKPNVWARSGRERYPIDVLVAPSLAQTFVEAHIGQMLETKGRARFRVVFAQEAKFRLSKRK